MIYCPRCGTANRDGSRFCNECGENLGGPTRVRCARCGTMNPVQSVFCSECGGQLLSSASESPGGEASPAIKGLSLPTKGPADEPDPTAADSGAAEEDVPAWLRELGAARPSVKPENKPQAEDEADVPDWLRDLRGSFPGGEVAAAPSPASDEDAPDWLGRLRREAGTRPPAELPEPEAEEDVPAWLAQIRPPVGVETPGPGAGRRAEEEDVPDWLAELQSTGEEAPDAAQTGEGESLPDWLAGLRPPAAAQAAKQVPSKAEEESIPDWLAELQTSAKETSPAPPEAEEEVLPDWLAELRAKAGAEKTSPAAPEAEEEVLPDWLAGRPPAGPAEADTGTEEALPDWLAELRPEAGAKPTRDEEESVPDWLAALRATTAKVSPSEGQPDGAAEEPSTTESRPVSDDQDILDWLAAMKPEVSGAEPAPETPAGEGQEETALPDWLVQVPSGEEAAEPGEGAASEMPEWLQAVEPVRPRPAADQETGSDLPAWLVPSAREPGEESLARAEIPPWLLALKPAELREQDEEEEGFEPPVGEPSEETGLLAGLRGALPVEMLIAQPRAVASAEPPPVVEGPTAQARLFAQVVGRGPEAVPKPLPQPRQGVLARLPLWITYLALLAAVTLPLLLQSSPLERSIEPPAAVLDLYETIEALEPGRPALVVFDYDPSSSDEMNVVAQAVVGHLMDRGVPVVAMSLLPAGPPVAQSVLEALAAGRPGSRYANLGYLSGQAAAVQLVDQGLEEVLLQNLQGAASPDVELVGGVTGFESFGLLLVLAAEPEGLRIWIEQAGALQGAPVAAAVSALTEPLARSYYQTDPRQLRGLVAGVPAAAIYQALRSDDGRLPAEMAARLDSHLAGHAVLILVLVVGNLAHLVRRGPQGRR
jgi:hypothetical protein